MGAVSSDAVMPDQKILALNGGSSSLKFGLYELRDGALQAMLQGEAEGVGATAKAAGKLTIKDAQGAALHSAEETFADLRSAAERVFDEVAPHLHSLTAIAHRIVHGGPEVLEHQRLTPEVRAKLEAAKEFAPLHVPPALAVIDAATARFPDITQIVCLDTAFHRTMPERARRFALPNDAVTGGVQRYGAHGLSLESAVAFLGPKLKARAVIAHLGGGCSVTAVHNGLSADTTMGLTPTGGMMMGTRTGDLDPGVLLYLLRHRGYTADTLEDLVDRRSGLLGVAGQTADRRALPPPATPRGAGPRLPLEMFGYEAAQAIAKMAVALGDSDGMLDQLIFTGGIGEHASEARAAICAPLRVLGVVLDSTSNAVADAADAARISSPDSRVEVLLVPAQEELRMAHIARELCAANT